MRTPKLRTWILAVIPLLAGCIDGDAPTSPDVEAAALNLLGGLEVGQGLTIEGEDAGRIQLSGEDGAEYILVPFFATDGDKSVQVDIEASNTRAPAPGGVADRVAEETSELLPGQASRRSDRFHHRLRSMESGLVDQVVRDRARGDRTTLFADRTPQAQTAPPEGEIITLNSPRHDAANICQDPVVHGARVEAVGERVIIAVDTANPVDFEPADIQQIEQEFDDLVWPVTTRNFGDPTDIDGNSRVILFFTRAVNEMTPAGSDGIIFGFHWGGDLFPVSDCAASNEAEMVYLAAPDPNGTTNGIAISREYIVTRSAAFTAHEVQHLINLSRRIYVNSARIAEEVWLNEGLSHIAEELLFYEATNLEPGRNITLDMLTASQARLDAVNRLQVSNLARYLRYLQDADRQSIMGPDNLETRGAAWSFVRYAIDQSDRPDQEILYALANSTTSGLSNLQRVLDAAALDLMQTWSASVFADDKLPNAPEALKQRSWNFRSVLPALTSDNSFPLVVQRLDSSGSLRATLQGGGAAFVRVGVDDDGVADVGTTADGGTPPSAFRLSVVRIR